MSSKRRFKKGTLYFMEIISEGLTIENKEMLPQILMRIYSVCKNDKSFHLRHKMDKIDEQLISLSERIEKQERILKESQKIRLDLTKRLDEIKQETFDNKSRLLEELGSEI
jgi:septal ring factor EnvC (AmiA/AmiB activator)